MVVKMGSLIEFLKREVALNALEKSINHARIVQSCVEELGKGLTLLLHERKPEEAEEVFHKVDIIENDADKLRREIQKDISRGELNPSVRQNLSHLVKRMDDVANCCTGVARRINTIPEKFWDQSSKESIKIVLEMMDNTVSCSEFLDKILVDLLEERKNIKEYARQINQYEHKIDLLNIQLRKNLQLTHYDVNQFTVFTVGNIFDILEAISDSIEGVADYIMVLVTSTESI
jgi:predicted phosphate transport protein (TIGR00153 family)